MRKLLMIAVTATLAPAVLGTTLYVSTTGADDSSGESAETPLRTINRALEVLQAGGEGGRILLAPGTYEETPADTAYPTNCLHITAAVTIAGTGEAPEATVIKPVSGKQYRVVKLANPEATLRNLTVTGGVIPSTWKENLINFGANVWITQDGGRLENCIIRDGACRDYGGAAANVFAEGGTVSHCKLIGGKTNIDGAGWKSNQQGGSLICRGTCVVDNTLITGCVTNTTANLTKAGGGPVYVHDSGKLVNCTITGNASTYCGGVIVGSVNARVVNCAIVGNSGDSADPAYAVCRVHRSSPAATFDPTVVFENCAADVELNESCITVDDPDWSPEFVPNATSPLVDRCAVADVVAGMMREQDLAQAPRLRGPKSDIGCYECQTSPAIVFDRLDASIDGGKAKLTIRLARSSLPVDLKLMATVDGLLSAVDAGVFFKGEEKTFEYAESALYSIGIFAHCDQYDLSGQVGIAYLGDERDDVLFVSKSGDDGNDGKSPERAKLTINNAIASLPDGAGKVYVAPGVYDTELNSEYDAGSNRVVVASACTLIGAGASNEDTILTSAAGKRVLALDHESACVRNLTVRDGSVTWNSSSGTVIQSCKGANVWIKKGTMENCVIRDGHTSGYNSCAGNLFMNDGRVSNCKLVGGTTSGNGRNYSYSEGGSISMAGGVMENCLITGCQAIGTTKLTGGGPINIYGTAKLINCTITGNDGAWTGGVIVGSASARSVNCAIYDNTLSTEPGLDTDLHYRPTKNASVAKNVTNATKTVTYYFDHAATSAEGLTDAGAAYVGTSATDLIGMPRVIGPAVDIGCYEAFGWRRLQRGFRILIR
ncbi:MAG: hypothetical protein ACI4RD_11165 [Kiritimatiellia bacterium]